ncbi:Lrp/AsnC family transcriptional regulator [Bradyrhizobium sp. U87765 SZCCT0131]|uniref:Lrp/AsnC family transcriptional regulator n=1 Tax=unclassified Bradyrhizobium TaxID=2631580 RepID=UPI001BAAB723|nr:MULTISPECIES: Lrp/AsnC family transcriptional regulator [unclassified Bradyrhizobium]MBR1218808.1 Lrp/AsnC family transcriptional regulator [Bradyrhizobium sp. U87765 SZCCT0131]MBR1261459.1 Lrp/AsnC family transcriptional regulator [Bradyrhizobium sp. U87765 SZCCT0134]MBR1306688.1 Lrp/AsnC family transcriptional regulator [Bradyrhizobium sp. U87765 SZCCT0110]MBR1317241.1 Lrp/AsnC family transcriptional regulator [Bradyrhizobium sp. U87765 SZCCT0109]MBR1350943.1 Lrp/AsnC family transcription
MQALDTIDRQILRHLKADGRISNVKLAAAVGLSPSACLRRVQILEEQGTIRGYTAIVEGPDTGAGIVIIVQITLERQTEQFLHRFEAAVRKHPEIRECYLMTGGSDYLLHVEAESAAGYEAVHKEILSRLPGVARIHSSFTIRRVLPAR